MDMHLSLGMRRDHSRGRWQVERRGGQKEARPHTPKSFARPTDIRPSPSEARLSSIQRWVTVRESEPPDRDNHVAHDAGLGARLLRTPTQRWGFLVFQCDVRTKLQTSKREVAPWIRL